MMMLNSKKIQYARRSYTRFWFGQDMHPPATVGLSAALNSGSFIYLAKKIGMAIARFRPIGHDRIPVLRCVVAAVGLFYGISASQRSGALAQTFQAQGPAPITNSFGKSFADNGGLAIVPNLSAASGAIGPVVADPANSRNMWIGSINGGVWGSTDGGVTWKPLTDKQPSLSIGALALDLASPVATRTLVAGFGNFSNSAGTGGALVGLAMSVDGGADWKPIGGSTLAGHDISGVAVSHNIILAAASDQAGGLWLSTDRGQSFTPVAVVNGPVTSLAADPAKPGTYYAAAVPAAGQNATVWASKNYGKTWDALFTQNNSDNGSGKVVGATTQILRVAAGPNGSVAVGVANTSGNGAAAQGVFLYDATTMTWASLKMPAVLIDPARPALGTFGINTGNQAATDFAVAVDPSNPKIVYVAGDTQDLALPDQPPNGIGSTGYFATVFRLQLAADGTSNFTALTNDFALSGTAPHADSRVITFDPSGNLLMSADGGLYVRSNPQSNLGLWNGMNTGLQLLEAYKAAYDPVTGSILAAAQDNATPVQLVPGSLAWTAYTSGDGFNIGVNSVSRRAQSESVLYLGNNGLSVARYIGSGPGKLTAAGQLNFTVNGTGIAAYEDPPDPNAKPPKLSRDLPLASQFELNRANPQLLAVGTNRVYVGSDPLTPQSLVTGDIALTQVYQPAEASAVVNALAYGTDNNPAALLALYAGSSQPVMVSTASALTPNTFVPASGWVYSATAPVAGVFDPRDANKFYIVDTANIYGTATGGTSFQNLRGNLPASFSNLRAVEYLSNNGVNALFVGGQDSSWTPGPPLYVAQANALRQWTGFGNNLPNAIIDNLTYSKQGDMLVVATLGRGVFSLYDVTSFFRTATVLNFGAANNDSTPIASQLTDGIDADGNGFSRGLDKNGVGLLSQAVPATYTGPTNINLGMMRAAAPGVFAQNSAFTVAQNGALDLGGYTQTIGSLAGGGQVNLGIGTLLTGGNGQSTEFSGVMFGQGGLIKQGNGTFTFSGGGAFNGVTNVDAGTLNLASSGWLSGGVSVQPDAVLTYAGAIGGALVSGGDVSLAATGTRVTLGGSLSLLPGGTLTVPVTGGGANGAAAGGINAGGAATLNGVMQLRHVDGVPALPDNAPIVAAGGVSGQFAMVTGEAPGARFALDYQPNRVVLVPLQSGFVDLAQTGNERAVAAALDASTSPPTTLVNILSAQPVGAIAGDLANLSGASYTAFETNAVSATRTFQTAILLHMGHAADQQTDAEATVAGAATLPVQTAGPGDRFSFGGLLAAASSTASATLVRVRPWVETYGRFDQLNSAKGAPGMSANGGVVMVGADVPLDHGILPDGRAGLGTAVAYDFADLSASGLSATNQQAYRISGYGWSTLGAAWFGGSLDYGHVTTQATREIGFGNDLGQSRVSPSGNVLSGQVVLARPFSFSDIRLMPQAALQGLHYTQVGFTEAGTTNAELEVASRTRDALRSVIGITAARTITTNTDVVLTPQAMLGWSHEFLDPSPRINSSFTSGGPAFAAYGATPGRDALLAGMTLLAQVGRAALFVSYGVSLATNETVQIGTVGLKVTW